MAIFSIRELQIMNGNNDDEWVQNANCTCSNFMHFCYCIHILALLLKLNKVIFIIFILIR